MSEKVLKGRTYKTKRVQDLYECLVFCNNEAACQSYIYVITGKICELNDRTKKEKPDDFVQDETRFYVGKWKIRGSHLSVLEPVYFTRLKRYCSVTQRAMQMCYCIFEAIRHGTALGP